VKCITGSAAPCAAAGRDGLVQRGPGGPGAQGVPVEWVSAAPRRSGRSVCRFPLHPLLCRLFAFSRALDTEDNNSPPRGRLNALEINDRPPLYQLSKQHRRFWESCTCAAAGESRTVPFHHAVTSLPSYWEEARWPPSRQQHRELGASGVMDKA